MPVTLEGASYMMSCHLGRTGKMIEKNLDKRGYGSVSYDLIVYLRDPYPTLTQCLALVGDTILARKVIAEESGSVTTLFTASFSFQTKDGILSTVVSPYDEDLGSIGSGLGIKLRPIVLLSMATSAPE